MRKFVLISAALLQISWCYAYPGPAGVGAYAYQDSSGHRYGGTYDLKDNINPFSDPFAVPFNDVDTFFPDYFRNYENILQQIFASDLENQRLASYAAQKAYDLTFNQPGYHTNFLRFPNFGGFPFFGPGPTPFNMAQGSHNAAFAGAAAGPGFSHQVAGIDPVNVNIPNVDVTNRFNNVERSNSPGKFYSVSSSSFASSSNLNGKAGGHREAETVVNDNGRITKYKVHS
ncbi:uncharacterized protein LOC120628800 isoform X1 [Pararge aegeria]|uniref:uncharacterized protein LOC120628800 isoform X1 n=1 Tax=Pararge aegeria TaxID=116150 RepID=UPI0019CF8FD5|nr:uncharacterized protein LOC120628800 isoform X1 [Pararge aegeria]